MLKPKQPKPSPTALYKPGKARALPNLAKQRLIQQMAILDTHITHAKSDTVSGLDQCRIIVETADHALAEIGPIMEQWIANGFTPDTPKYRKLAALYLAHLKRRNEAKMAESIFHKTGEAALRGG